MRRVILFSLVLATLCVLLGLPAEAQPNSITLTVDSPACTVDGQVYTLQQAPVIVDGYMLIPLPGLATALNASLQWAPVQQEATFTWQDGSRRFTATVNPGSDELALTNAPGPGLAAQFIQQTKVDLGQPPLDLSGGLFLPLRPLGQALGYQVIWQPDTRSATLTRE